MEQKPQIHTPSKLSVLMVSTYPPDKDGIASYTARLEKALKKENVQIAVAANGRDWKRNSPTYIFSIIRKAITSNAGIVHVQLSYFMFGNEYFTGLFPVLSAGLKLLGKKVVVTFHDVVQRSVVKDKFLKSHTGDRLLSLKRWAMACYTWAACAIADRVVVHSETAKNVLAQDYGVAQNRIQVIPHGIDQSTVHAKADFHGGGSARDPDRRIVSYFGLVKQGKGLEDLVKAWRKVQDANVQLLIIGGKHPTIRDDCYETLTSLVKEWKMGTSIRFCGYVPDERLPAYFAESEAFVFPYNEWGDVIASSGALSFVAPYLKPIVATDVPAFHHLKDMGAAVIVQRGDVDGLASAIIEVLNDVQTRNTLKAKLQKWLPESSWTVVARRTTELYARLV
jgi:glycosyltransferase involved in cell wall biosynthesis